MATVMSCSVSLYVGNVGVELDTLELDGGGYNSFRNIWAGQSGA